MLPEQAERIMNIHSKIQGINLGGDMTERVVEVNGQKEVIKNDHDQIRYVVGSRLKELGWMLVCNEKSGVYAKDGFTLFVYPNRGGRETRLTVKKQLLANAVKGFTIPRVSWQLEKYGALIAAGKLSLSLSYLYEINSFEDSEFMAFIDEIQSYLEMSRYELNGLKTVYKCINIGKKFVPSADSVFKSRFFLCINTVPQLPQFEKSHVYGILQVTRKTFSFAECDRFGQFIGKLQWLKDDAMMTFMENSVNGFFHALDLQIDNPYSVVQVSLQDFHGASIPTAILELNLPENHNRMISHAIFKRMNIMPLLRDIEDMKVLGNIFELINLSSEYELLQNVPLDTGWLELLKQAAVVGFSLYDFVNAASAEEAKSLLLENISNFDCISEGLRSKYSVSAIKGLKFISTSSNKKSDVESGANEFHVYLQQMASEGIMLSLVQMFLRDGMSSSDRLFVRGSYVTKNAIAELRAYLASPDFVCLERMWDDLLEEMLRKMEFVIYSRNTGFIITSGNGRVGRQPGGFVFYDMNLNPVFRAFKLNGEYVKYGDETIIRQK